MDYSELIVYLGYFFLVLNTLLFFKSYKKENFAFKVFSIYLFVILLIQIYANYLSTLNRHNLFLSHYYFIIQFVLLSLFFRSILIHSLKKVFVNGTLIVVLLMLGIYYVCFPGDYFIFNQFEIIITSVPLIVYCFLFFLHKLSDIDKKYVFIISGFFVYLLCSTLLFTTGNIGSKSVKKIIWDMNSFLYLVYHILIFVEWYKNFRKPAIAIPKE